MIRNHAWVFLSVSGALLFHSPLSCAASGLSAEQIVQRMVQRLEETAVVDSIPVGGLTKVTLVEEFDGNGRLRERREKFYEISYGSGKKELRMVRLNGRVLSGAELRHQQAREAQEKKKLMEGESSRELLLKDDVLDRYQFEKKGEEMVRGRLAYALAFEVKPGWPARQWRDRLFNQLAGTVWVDVEEFEIARAEIHLRNEVQLLSGILGTLRKLQFTLDRSRLDPGVWIDARALGDFQGRKLFDPTRIRSRSEIAPILQLGSSGR
jgi:hypothetical protein